MSQKRVKNKWKTANWCQAKNVLQVKRIWKEWKTARKPSVLRQKKGREAAQHKSGVFEEIWSPEMQHFGPFLSVMQVNWCHFVAVQVAGRCLV